MSKISKLIGSITKPFKSRHSEGREEEDLQAIAVQEQRVFSLTVLSAATRNFHLGNKLGEGGFGPVYKGTLRDGREIAVKKLSHASRQGQKEFKNEAELLSRVQHRNVVNLLGYCTEGVEPILVYEYVHNESLDKHLFDPQKRSKLDWPKRLDIIHGVARGLLYLHQGAHCRIIHRDIKAGNILLDERWQPKISDFGMARLFPEDGKTHVNTRVAGTNGYMAPEYVMHGDLSERADVFSFGVVVLEIISGKKNSTFQPLPEAQCLLEWVWRLFKKDRSLEIMDPTLAASAEVEQVKMCTHIGLLCTQADPQLRPLMNRVVTLFHKKPGNIEEEPTRPGFHGQRYRRHSKPGSTSYGISSTSRSAGSSSRSSASSTNVTAGASGTSNPMGPSTSRMIHVSGSNSAGPSTSGTRSVSQSQESSGLA
ncbi:cysteine-rich receptor-like protein kinase 43 [Nymphaea colorata]|nr:cysteine-rich receptor-like protein kinase 43 [Nymphaea colorata]